MNKIERVEVSDREDGDIDNGPISSSNNKINEVNIRQLDYGYVVTVGCQIFAFETPEKLIEKLTAYVNCPNKVVAEWKAGTFLK